MPFLGGKLHLRLVIIRKILLTLQHYDLSLGDLEFQEVVAVLNLWDQW
jgi:hypothetical protein